jgi:hypothetical protein
MYSDEEQHMPRDLDREDWVAYGIKKLTQDSAKQLMRKSDGIQTCDKLRSILVDATGASSFEELKVRLEGRDLVK